MKSNIFIPPIINVGYQNRSGTYTGKLAYVIYYDEKGKLRKETSWNSWRDEKMGNYQKQMEQSRETGEKMGENKNMEENLRTEMSLEDRYTQAMQLAGYERIPVNANELATVAFRNIENGETIWGDGWQCIGSGLEEMSISDIGNAQEFEELIHPQGRLKYYTKNPGDIGPDGETKTVMHKSFEEAFKAYTESGWIDGKTLGFVLGENSMPLIWYDFRSMENVLYRASDSAMRYAPDATQNELSTLRKNMNQAVVYLQKENVLVQLMQAVTDIKFRAVNKIFQRNVENLADVTGRLANYIRPQDYFEIGLSPKIELIEGNKGIRNWELFVRTVHANEVVGESKFLVSGNDIENKGVDAFRNKEFEEWMKAEVMNVDTDFMPLGQRSFVFYNGLKALEEHYEKLERAGYERFPSDEQYIKAEQESVLREESVDMEYGRGEKVTVAIESTKDFSDHDIGFYTYQYQDGREGVQYRLVTIGDDGGLIPYPTADKYFFDHERIQKYIDAHAENLEIIPYDDIVYKSGLKMYEVKLQELNEQRICEDIKKSGFKPDSDLVKNILKFEELEGKRYTLKELAELRHQNPKFQDQLEKKECFEKIIKECQEQETEMNQSVDIEQAQESSGEKSAFLKQEMMEQMTPV